MLAPANYCFLYGELCLQAPKKLHSAPLKVKKSEKSNMMKYIPYTSGPTKNFLNHNENKLIYTGIFLFYFEYK